MFLTAAAAYFCVAMIYKNIIPDSSMLPEKHFSGTTSMNIRKQKEELSSDKNKYNIIVKRNLFKVEIEEKQPSFGNKKIEDKIPEIGRAHV